jgi:two-component system, NarL family, sensor histidine kinase DevS
VPDKLSSPPPDLPVQDLLALLDGLPASVALWDQDVRLRYANRRALVRFGRPAKEILGAHLSELVRADSVELSAQYIEGALAGRPQQVERAIVGADGQRHHAHQVTHTPNIVDGTVHGYSALAVDITGSVAGYDEARHAREQAALIAERERIAANLDKQVLDELGTALEKLTAALERASDVLPSLRTAADAIDTTIAELRSTVAGRMLGDQRSVTLPAAFPRLSAPFETVPVDGASEGPPIQVRTGVPWPSDVTGLGWSVNDVVALLDQLPAVITMWDASWRNVFANRAAVRWLGRTSRADVLGKPAQTLGGPEVHQANRGYAQAALRGEPQQFECTVVRSGGLRHIQVGYTPKIVNGVVDGIYSFVVDVTARVEAELALQDARAEMATVRERERIADDLHNLVIQRLFAAGLAAMTPAAAATGAAQAQVRSVQDGIGEALSELESAVQCLPADVGLIDLLPELARVVEQATRPHNIAATIESVGSVEYVAPDLGTDLLAVAAEALSNVARHAAASNVVVTIAADVSGVWLRVVDDGRGVGSEPQGRGTADMIARASRGGGSCTWRPNQPTGTIMDWRVPQRGRHEAE